MATPAQVNEPTPSRSALPRWYPAALTLAFAASLAAPHVARLSGLAGRFDPAVENREAAGFPSVAWRRSGWLVRPRSADVLRFPAGLEDYLLDRTGFRQEGVAAVGWARRAGWLPDEAVADCMPARLRAEPATHVAVRGAEGWCYFVSGMQVAELSGRGVWPDDRVAATWRRFEERAAWLAAHGIAYVVVAAPNKETVYPEHLPPWAALPQGRTPLDQLVEHAARAGGAPLVDLRPELRAAKARGRTYYREDTHWTNFGALVGCRAVMRECTRHCPEMIVPPLEGYVGLPSVLVGGDLARMLGTPGSVEEVDVFEWRGDDLARGKERPAVFLLGDSFTAALRSHLARWCDVVGAGGQNEFPAERILAARPRIVVHEFLERNMHSVGFDNPAVVVQAARLNVADAAAAGDAAR